MGDIWQALWKNKPLLIALGAIAAVVVYLLWQNAAQQNAQQQSTGTSSTETIMIPGTETAPTTSTTPSGHRHPQGITESPATTQPASQATPAPVAPTLAPVQPPLEIHPVMNNSSSGASLESMLGGGGSFF